MKKQTALSAVCLLCACQMSAANAEGVALTEWSSRGIALGGGMVGRADDASAIAYNAAGITQLPGMQVMVGYAAIDPESTIELDIGEGSHTSIGSRSHILSAPSAYLSRQIDDRFWLGLGLFSRFGLENQYSNHWPGRYNVTDVDFNTYSIVPTVAMKVNDALSLSAGVEIMYASSTLGRQIPCYKSSGSGVTVSPIKDEDIKMKLDGSGWGAGVHLGLHWRMNDQWSLGFAYKSPVMLHVNGTADFSRETSNLLAETSQVPHAIDTHVHGKVRLPDSFALGLAYRPQENLSFELGTVYTRWSTYHPVIKYDTNFRAQDKKEWRNGWNFNASVEYEPMDWLALRAGVWYETPVTNEAYADYMVPGHGRTGVSLGTGFQRDNWRLDMSYAHIWMRDLDYSRSGASGVAGQIRGGNSCDLSANIYSVSLVYTF